MPKTCIYLLVFSLVAMTVLPTWILFPVGQRQLDLALAGGSIKPTIQCCL